MKTFICDVCGGEFPRITMIQDNHKTMCKYCQKGIKPPEQVFIPFVSPVETITSEPNYTITISGSSVSFDGDKTEYITLADNPEETKPEDKPKKTKKKTRKSK